MQVHMWKGEGIINLHLHFLQFFSLFSSSMRSASVPALRSYSFIVFGFCLLFLIFGYRSLRSSSQHGDSEEDYYEDGGLGSTADGNDAALVKTLQARCNEKNLEKIGEYAICMGKAINREKNCLIFSVATNSDLKFEMTISEGMDKCRVRVYDHEAKATDSDGKYKVIEKLEAEKLTEKALGTILGAEKKGKTIHVLRLDAGVETAKLAQSKLLKERQVCHLLMTIPGLDIKQLETLAKKMQQSYGYSLYAINPLRGKEEEEGKEGEEEEAEVNKEEEPEDEDEDYEEDKKTDEVKGGGRGKDQKEKKANSQKAARKYALSFIGKHCQKNYEIK